MKFQVLALSAYLALFWQAPAAADESRVKETWHCTTKNESSMEEVKAANADWLRFVNRTLPAAHITSGVMAAIVGDYSHFAIVDSYPDLEAWATIKKALETPEGKLAGSGLDDTVNCTGNTLEQYTPSE